MLELLVGDGAVVQVRDRLGVGRRADLAQDRQRAVVAFARRDEVAERASGEDEWVGEPVRHHDFPAPVQQVGDPPHRRQRRKCLAKRHLAGLRVEHQRHGRGREMLAPEVEEVPPRPAVAGGVGRIEVDAVVHVGRGGRLDAPPPERLVGLDGLLAVERVRQTGRAGGEAEPIGDLHVGVEDVAQRPLSVGEVRRVAPPGVLPVAPDHAREQRRLRRHQARLALADQRLRRGVGGGVLRPRPQAGRIGLEVIAPRFGVLQRVDAVGGGEPAAPVVGLAEADGEVLRIRNRGEPAFVQIPAPVLRALDPQVRKEQVEPLESGAVSPRRGRGIEERLHLRSLRERRCVGRGADLPLHLEAVRRLVRQPVDRGRGGWDRQCEPVPAEGHHGEG